MSQVLPGVLTLTTDFGYRDHYVGAMKGVVASLAPGVQVSDITHDVPSFDIAEGAFAIAQAWRCYPDGTVHVVVVDPGVGSSRAPIAAAAGQHFFVAPDNGVLSQVLESVGTSSIRRVDTRHGLEAISRTFHGRDLFAPVAARLAAGLMFEDVGPSMAEPIRLPPVTVTADIGAVLHVDRFGNIVTSFRPQNLTDGSGLEVAGRVVGLRADSYADAPQGEPFLILGSSGYVEISLNQGSAAASLQARAGARVALARLRSGEGV
ncbi:MAG: SAM-dependent chlorinase/fluorinase [Bryobacterales bacterium]|nr:SAM-dependent chlorinase/fluorinase [Bryobacterales bacterium]